MMKTSLVTLSAVFGSLLYALIFHWSVSFEDILRAMFVGVVVALVQGWFARRDKASGSQ